MRFGLRVVLLFFFFNDPATTEIYTLSLHDALPISPPREGVARRDDRNPVDTVAQRDRKSTRLNSSHLVISYAVFCLKKKRVMPMLRFFRHGDGNFAQFNGMGPTPVDLLATVLAYDDARGTPVSNAPHSGYQRIDAGQTALLMDTGRPPPVVLSQEAHAGCLSFELSWKQHRLVVNCGLPAVNKENWRQVARATPAHSTVTLNDRSSCRFLESLSVRQLFGGTPIISGPRDVRIEREPGTPMLRASHDGYVSDCNILHTRAIRASPDGSALEGEDSFTRPDGQPLPADAPDEFAIRFHLHPAIKASRLADGRGVILLLHDRDLWTFATLADTVELEESVFLAGTDGPRRTVQIVIYGRVGQSSAVRWTFRHTPPAAPGARPDRAQEPELPL